MPLRSMEKEINFELMTPSEYEDKLIKNRISNIHPLLEGYHKSYKKLKKEIRDSLNFDEYIYYIKGQETKISFSEDELEDEEE